MSERRRVATQMWFAGEYREVVDNEQLVYTEFVADQARRQLIEILENTSDFVERIAVTGETLYINRATRKLLGQEEGGHDRRRAGAAYPILLGDQLDLACLVAQAVVSESLDGEHRL